MEITDDQILIDNYSDDTTTERYQDFREGEDIPVHHGLFYHDRDSLETGQWDRTGERGALLNLHGIQGVWDIHMHDLTPGGETSLQHHLYQEIVYVSQGRGATEIGQGDDTAVFEWQEGSLFFIPQAVPYRHMNHSASENAHLFSQTTLPSLLELVQYTDLIFEPNQDLWEEALREEDFFSANGELRGTWSDENTARWVANFVPDLNQFDKLQPRSYRGAGTNINFKFPNSSIRIHAAEFPRGTYKKAHHRAGPASVYTIISGEGYSTMWQPEWDEIGKIEWEPGTIISYPHDCLHQHFNTGDEPARYIAWHSPNWGTLGDIDLYSSSAPQNQIEYHEEDPVVREHYKRSLEGTNQEFRMPDECYTNPDFAFDEEFALE